MRHSHTYCICLAFLHCVFSNVFSKSLDQSRHSHTGCICLTFLHCAFSNVSSNHLLEKRHNHIGCICLTFLHCEFSNVSSNGLPVGMQSHIGCIYLTWWHCQSYSSEFLHLHPLNQSCNSPFVLPLPMQWCDQMVASNLGGSPPEEMHFSPRVGHN